MHRFYKTGEQSFASGRRPYIANYPNFNFIMTSSETISISLSIAALAVSIVTAYQQFKSSKDQLSLARSQNIKSYFEQKLQSLLTEGLQPLDTSSAFSKRLNTVNKINCPNFIWELEVRLLDSPDFANDLQDFEHNRFHNREYFETRDYYGDVLFLNSFTLALTPTTFFYSDISRFLDEINLSPLHNDDKYYLKKKVRDEILMNYLAKCNFNPAQEIPIPIFFGNMTKGTEVIFKPLITTNFSRDARERFAQLEHL